MRRLARKAAKTNRRTRPQREDQTITQTKTEATIVEGAVAFAVDGWPEPGQIVEKELTTCGLR
jgi:hypothetical protein